MKSSIAEIREIGELAHLLHRKYVEWLSCLPVNRQVEGCDCIKQQHEQPGRNWLDKERHEQVVQRREHEQWQDWNDRQWLENPQHDQIMKQIEIDVALLFVGC